MAHAIETDMQHLGIIYCENSSNYDPSKTVNILLRLRIQSLTTHLFVQGSKQEVINVVSHYDLDFGGALDENKPQFLITK